MDKGRVANGMDELGRAYSSTDPKEDQGGDDSTTAADVPRAERIERQLRAEDVPRDGCIERQPKAKDVPIAERIERQLRTEDVPRAGCIEGQQKTF